MMQLPKYKEDIVEKLARYYEPGRSSTRQFDLMLKSKVSNSGSENRDRQPFQTIDDLVQRAEELFAGLKKLSKTKYPLDIRRGVRREVDKHMTISGESTQIKAGSRTYFFDIKTTREGKPYLIITESRFKGEGADRQRNSIMLFQENSDEFAKAVSEMAAKLQKE